MRLADSWKTFSDGGVSKHVAPQETFEIARERIARMREPILQRYYRVRRPSGIPQYAFVGTGSFGQYRPWPTLSNGKGHTPSQALASGIMEMIERYSCFKYLSPASGKARARCSFDTMRSGAFGLEDFLDVVVSPDQLARGVIAELRKAGQLFYRASALGGRAVQLPLRQIVYLIGSNGMAAGNSLPEAVLQAICEVIERYCTATIELQRLATPTIEASTIANPIARDLLERLRFDGKEILVKDFSLGLGLPVIGVVRKTKRGRCLITAGVATSRDEALVRTLTENSQTDADQNYVRTADVKYHFAGGPAAEMRSLPDIAEDNITAELRTVAKVLRRRGMKAYFVDTTDEELGIPSVIAVVTRARQAGVKPMPASVLGGLIDECAAAGDYARARRYLAMGRKLDGSKRLFWGYYAGVISAARGRFDEAEDHLRPVVADSQEPRLVTVPRAHLALCRHAKGQAEAATDWHLKVHDLAAHFSFERMAQEYKPVSARTKRLYEAAARFHREFLVVGSVTRAQGAALKRKCKAYARTRDAALADMEIARTHFNAGRLREAAEHARRITRTAPVAAKVFNLHLFLARCHMGMGEYGRAMAELRKAQKATPEDEDVLALREECRQKLRTAQPRREPMRRRKLKGIPDRLTVSAGELKTALKRSTTPR